jgi:hypothetical protein
MSGELQSEALFSRRDLLVGSSFALTNVVAHLVWNPMVEQWQFVVTALMFTTFLVIWLGKELRRLQLFVTKFYCVVATLDLFAEGLLQPLHHCTLDNLLCTGRMFLVFLGFWLLSHPLESRFFHRRRLTVPATTVHGS